MRNYYIVSTAVLVIALASFAGAANAAETKEVTKTVTTYTLSDNPEFEKKVMAVCGDKNVHLSPKAKTACDTKTFPNITKTSRQFRNAGFGAELNALASQR